MKVALSAVLKNQYGIIYGKRPETGDLFQKKEVRFQTKTKPNKTMKNQLKTILIILSFLFVAGCAGITESTLPVASEPVSTEFEMADMDRGDIFNTGSNEEVVADDTKSKYMDRD